MTNSYSLKLDTLTIVLNKMEGLVIRKKNVDTHMK